MRKLRQNTGIWKFLEESGVLKNGTEEQIKAARRKYKKKYILAYKRKQRAEQQEFTVMLNQEEQKKISEWAKSHKMSAAGFLKTSALAYMEKIYVVPDREAVAHLEQMLIQILNEIQNIAKRNKILFGLNPIAIEKRIKQMEEVVISTLRNPIDIEEYFKNNPSLQAKLISPKNHDCENKDAKKTIIQTTA